jgi:hypothetical protein
MLYQRKLQRGSIDTREILSRGPFLVFLLGAGSSKDIGMPTTLDLLSGEYFDTIAGKFGLLEESKRTFADYRNSNLGFEQLLMEALETNNQTESAKLLAFYEDVLRSAETMAGTAINCTSEEWLQRTEYYMLFARYLKALGHQHNYPVVISFNHDLWVETSSLWEGFNYGSLTNRLYNTMVYPNLPRFGDGFTLLKLHGSFNYLWCDTCQHIWCLTDYLWQQGGTQCELCESGTLHKVYVPPVRNKEHHQLFDSWIDAEHFLSSAKLLMVIGYSMPDYDWQSRELLSKLPEGVPIYIVDKYAAHMAVNYSFMKRNPKYFYSSTFQNFMNEVRAYNGIPTHKFLYFE